MWKLFPDRWWMPLTLAWTLTLPTLTLAGLLWTSAGSGRALSAKCCYFFGRGGRISCSYCRYCL